MKNAITIIAVVSLCGCSQQKTDPKIAELEKRVTLLESNLTVFNEARETTEKTLNKEINDTFVIAATNSLTAQNQQIDLTLAQVDIIQLKDSFSNLVGTINNKAPARYAPASQPNQNYSAMKNGVPIQIYDSIVAAAAEKWPGNFEMQDYEINNQVEAYKKLHGQ